MGTSWPRSRKLVLGGFTLGRGREVGRGWNLRSLQNYSLKTVGIGTLGSFVLFSWAQNAQNPTFKTVLPFVFGSRIFSPKHPAPSTNILASI